MSQRNPDRRALYRNGLDDYDQQLVTRHRVRVRVENNGFVAQTATGSAKQLISLQVASASGLVVATSAGQMSDVLPEAAPGRYDHAVEQDFVRVPNTILAITGPGASISQEGLVRMTDFGSDNLLVVTLVQWSLVDEMMENEDFMILRNAIHNSSGSRIEDRYAGLVIDWGGECELFRGLYGL